MSVVELPVQYRDEDCCLPAREVFTAILTGFALGWLLARKVTR